MRPSTHQIRLLIAQQMTPDSSALNHAVLLRPRTSAAADALRSAVLSMAAERDNLRCRFRRGGPDGWTSVDGPPAVPQTNVVALMEQDLRHRAQLEVDRPFDLAREPPLRIAWWTGPRGPLCQLTFHHVATDAHTLFLLLEELRARCAVPAGDLTTSHAYYEIAQKTALSHEDGRRDQLREYATDISSIDLSPMFGPIGRGFSRSTSDSWHIPDSVATAALRTAAEIGSTPFVVWLTAWTRALARLMDRWQFPIAVPVSTRSSRAEMSITGFFVNSVIVPIRHRPDESFAGAASRMREAMFDALDRRHLPLHELVRELDLDTRGTANPLMAVSSQLLAAPLDHIELPDSRVEVDYVESQESRYQISFEVRDHGGAYQGRLTADTRYLEPARLRTLQHLVECELSPPTTATAPAAVVDLPHESAIPTEPRSLLEPLAAWRRAAPDATALEWRDGRWSRQELANAISDAKDLITHSNAEPGDAVVLELPRGPQLVAALLGALDANVVPVMARPHVDAGAADQLEDQVNAVLTLTSGPEGLAAKGRRPNGLASRRRPIAKGTAYVTFTSGSTGRPKGVPAPLGGVAAYLSWVETTTGLSPSDRCLQLAAPGFDALIRDTLAPLRCGASLVLLPDEHRLNGPELRKAVVGGDITAILAMTPPQLRRLLAATHAAGPISKVRLLCVAGEPLFRGDLAGASRALPNGRVLNLYGPTETTMTVTCMPVGEETTVYERLPVGKPIAGSAIAILDARGAEVTAGCTGEVVVAGPGVATGYVGADPSGTTPFAYRQVAGQTRWTYATGDLGYQLGDDAGIRLIGRLDQERKVNGERVDIEAVEAAITSHPEVLDAAVHVDDSSGFPVVSAIVAFNREPLSYEQLRQFLTGKVPAAGLPRRMTVGAVARLPNGKLDRSVRPRANGIDVTPMPEVAAGHDEVSAAVQNLLGAVPADPSCSLFHLGLDSLQAIELLERLGVLTATSQAATRFFEDPRMATLVQLVAEAAASNKAVPPTAVRQERGGPAWLSGAGRGSILPSLVCFPHAGGDSPTFAPLAMALDGLVDVVVIRRPPPLERTGSMNAWLDAHVHETAQSLTELAGPVMLCGYSLGFPLACLVAQVISHQWDAGISRLIGINPGVPGLRSDQSPTRSSNTTEKAELPSPAQRAMSDLLHADLSLRDAQPVTAAELPPVLLFQTPRDRRRFDAAPGLLARFDSIEREQIRGDHIVTRAEMFRVGHVLRERIAQWHEQ
ncbi:AMP-binding protein [Kribbella voronezhensis]|nr:AMP-binding protein [Kribbella voronezhensis]